MTSRKQSTDTCHTSDIIREQLNELHGTLNLPWRKIAKMGEYKGIPAGTLCAIAKGTKNIPDKFKARFGILVEVPVYPCPIHGKPHLFNCQTQTVNKKDRHSNHTYKSLFDWPVHLLRASIENREEV